MKRGMEWYADAISNGLTTEQKRLLKSYAAAMPFESPELERLMSDSLVADGRCTPLGLAVLRLKR